MMEALRPWHRVCKTITRPRAPPFPSPARRPFPVMRHAFRSLCKSPGFTVVALLALALGIGANTAIFSVVYGVVLRPLPYPEQHRLLFIGEWSQQVPNMSVSYPNFTDWRDRQRAFTALGAFRFHGVNYVGPTESERLTGIMASHDLFAALAVPPLHGRVFSGDEDKPGAERTVLVSERLWRRLFAGRADALGEKLQLNGDFYTVVGVMPADFQFPAASVDVWLPLGLFADGYQERRNHPGLYCVARLKPGVSYDAGVADIKGIAEQLAREYPATNAHQSAAVQPLADRAFGRVRPALFVLLGAAGFVLLIACANVANLQLARAHGRAREFAVRAALGASRAQIVRQLLVESLMLGGAGCIVGVVFGVWGLDALRSLLPANVPRIDEVSLNAPVLAFAAVATLITSVVVGLVPAVHVLKQDLRATLVDGTRGSSGAGNRWRAGLIVGEFALTSVLLVGAGLMIRTLSNLYSADPGYATERILTVNWNVPGNGSTDAAQRPAVIRRALDRLATVPGVSSVALIDPLPLSGGGNQRIYYVEGSRLPEAGRQPSAEFFQTSGGLFGTLRIPLLAGRAFDERDSATAPKVAIVDTRFVEKNFPPGTDALEKRFVYGSTPPQEDSDWIQIVGIVAPIQNYGLASGLLTREQTYVPHTQSVPTSLTFVLRSDQNEAILVPAIRQAIREVAPELPIFGVQSMEELFTASVSTQRLTVFLLGAFAALAVTLASLGLYGVLAYNVGQRAREVGVRMALGATPNSVVALILRHGLKLAVAGLVVGLFAAVALTRVLGSILFGASAFDPLSFAAVAVGLTAVGALACYLPARRAARIDPMITLRAE